MSARVHIPGGPCYVSPDRNPEQPTWVWVPFYGFAFDEPTPTPPRDDRRERKERR